MLKTLVTSLVLCSLVSGITAQAVPSLPGFPGSYEPSIPGLPSIPDLHNGVICEAIHTPTGEIFVGRGNKFSAEQEALTDCRAWQAQQADELGSCTLLQCSTLFESF